jgi:hypothetical protein
MIKSDLPFRHYYRTYRESVASTGISTILKRADFSGQGGRSYFGGNPTISPTPLRSANQMNWKK